MGWHCVNLKLGWENGEKGLEAASNVSRNISLELCHMNVAGSLRHGFDQQDIESWASQTIRYNVNISTVDSSKRVLVSRP